MNVNFKPIVNTTTERFISGAGNLTGNFVKKTTKETVRAGLGVVDFAAHTVMGGVTLGRKSIAKSKELCFPDPLETKNLLEIHMANKQLKEFKFIEAYPKFNASLKADVSDVFRYLKDCCTKCVKSCSKE